VKPRRACSRCEEWRKRCEVLQARLAHMVNEFCRRDEREIRRENARGRQVSLFAEPKSGER